MSIKSKLRVMAIGSLMTHLRLSTSLADNNVDLTCLSQTPEAILHLQQERYDIIIIDSLLEEAGYICQCLYSIAKAPIALLVRETEVNWQKLGSWEVDGFLPENSSQVELLARLKAIARRVTPISPT
jgi:DNA-binding response OmpR family regulator